MKAYLLALLLSAGLPGWHWLVRVQEHNAAQAQGQAAVRHGRPAEAVYYYQRAVALAGRSGPAPTLLLALAQAQRLAGQDAAARTTYARLLAPTVPAAIGSTARQQLAMLLAQQQQLAQAISLLKQALLLNPANATARYNYELLSQYLAGHQPTPLPPPTTGNQLAPTSPHPKAPRDPTQPPDHGQAPIPGTQAGTARPSEAPTPDAPPQTDAPPSSPRPAADGQPDAQRPTSLTGTNAQGGFRPGPGEAKPLPSGTQPGRQRGLDASATATGAEAPTGRGRRPGTEAATNADLQLQTQRERLKAMSLTPAQAQQLLEALRASEQQYLQQRPRARQGTPPAPGTPTW
ncbi:MAG: tetratricopeptide repeat protein [Janthinobacterium lividum]